MDPNPQEISSEPKRKVKVNDVEMSHDDQNHHEDFSKDEQDLSSKKR